MSNAAVLHPESLYRNILAALRAWHRHDGAGDSFMDSLLLVRDQRRALPNLNASNLRLATNQVLQDGLNVLATHNIESTQILKLRFPDNQIILKVANILGMTEDEVKRKQRIAIEQLAQIIWEQETAVRHKRTQQLEAKLDLPTYTTLFGVEDLREMLTSKILSPESANIVCISGIGGIGKTSLANEIARHIIRTFHFENIVWLRAGSADMMPGDFPATLTAGNLMRILAQQVCPHMPPGTPAEKRDFQLRQVLKSSSHLIILDNLETDIEPELLIRLNDLAQPGKFLLTTRVQPPKLSGVFNLVLPGLAKEAVFHFIRYHAHEIGLADIAAAADNEIERVYNAVGGNPLALKLVINLTDYVPFNQVIKDLTQAKLGHVEDMYRHIYWKTWHSISNEAQTLLKVMPLTADSGSVPEQLQTISALSEKEMWTAVSELVRRSLLEVRGTTHDRRYGIHRLTNAFLQTEIIHWPQDRML